MTPDSTDAHRPQASSAAFASWFDRFLDAVLARHPVDATFFGADTHDHVLPDYSPEADADWVARASTLIRELDAIPGEGIPEAELYDRILARAALQIWSWEASAPPYQAGNPAFHTGQAVAGIVALFEGDALPADRTEAAIARMTAIPAFLETARRRIRSAPLPWTELAMRQCEAARRFLVDVAGAEAEQRNTTEREALQRAVHTAVAAFEEHETWLRSVLAERRIAFEPIGTDALDQYLHLGHLLPSAQTPQWWLEFAHAELVEATAELRELAKSIDWRATSRTLLLRLGDSHPSPAEYDDAFPAAWKRCRSVAVEAGLVTWPEAPVGFRSLSPASVELRRVVPLPDYRSTPGGTGWVGYPALDRSLPPEEQERQLQRMNDTRILLGVAVRQAGLGHHVQSAYARNAPTRIGRLAGTFGATRRLFFSGNAVTQGWACYAGELMEEIGVLTPLQRLSEAHRRLWVAARAVADTSLHTGELSMVRVARMYRDEVGLPASQAMEQAVRDSMQPGVGMAELVGTAGIDELRRAIEDREGAQFDLRRFHDRFLNHGAIPVTLIAASLLDAAS